jgi:hypothetical protein
MRGVGWLRHEDEDREGGWGGRDDDRMAAERSRVDLPIPSPLPHRYRARHIDRGRFLPLNRSWVIRVKSRSRRRRNLSSSGRGSGYVS